MNVELFKSMMVGGATGLAVAYWSIWCYEHPELVRRILWGVNGKP